MPAVRTWSVIALTLALTLGYLVTVHLAFTRHSASLAAVAMAILVVLVLLALKGPGRLLTRVLIAAVGTGLVVLTARGVPPVLLMLPPVLLPAAIAITFGRTLMRGRTPLIERVVRGFYAPEVPVPAVLRYARRVTWAWTLLLAAVALTNAWLLLNLSPGGLQELAGLPPRWPVSSTAFVWFANTGTYLLIAGMFVVEFVVRVWLFPDHTYTNPLSFIREARTRMPRIVEALRHG